MLELADVTLCAADCVTTSLAARALRISMERCTFGDVILFSDTAPASDTFRHVRIEKLGSRADYTRFILKDLIRFISTRHVLVAQWDGYVLDPAAWMSEFCRYDYIGARWAWHKDGMTVGNGGFSLRSRRLLEITSEPDFVVAPKLNEDEQICRMYRTMLTAGFGVQFAPEELADRFSYERSPPERPTFGFHGLFNLWRHVGDDEVEGIARELGPHIFRTVEFYELLAIYFRLRKFGPLYALYRRWSEFHSADERRAVFLSCAPPELVDRVLGACQAAASRAD